MATLAAQILTDWQATRETTVKVGETNAFDDDAAENTTLSTNASVKAAAMVNRYLGDGPDSTDDDAVELGVLCMDLKLALARVGRTPELIENERSLIEQLKDLQAARSQEAATPVSYDADGELVEDED